MLSRKRSPKSPANADVAPSPFRPILERLESSLRNVRVLDIVSLLREPSFETLLPQDSESTVETRDASGIRRLFSRDGRSRQPLSSFSHHLAVTSSLKNSDVKLCHVVDSERLSISRSWSLADLRKIDGLGGDVKESQLFALHFSTTRRIVFNTQSPQDRASFLWKLLQTCASRFRRAPPVMNLSLLDLQKVSERRTRKVAKRRITSRLTDSSANATATNKPSSPADTPPEAMPVVVRTRTSTSLVSHEDGTQRETPGILGPVTPQNAGRGNDGNETRSLNEVRGVSMSTSPQESDNMKLNRKSMSVDDRELAFTNRRVNDWFSLRSERSRMSDPKARRFNQRRAVVNMNTKKLIEERVVLRERKMFKLAEEEQQDLVFALGIFQNEGNDELPKFEEWLNESIKTAVASNIRDLVDVENKGEAETKEDSLKKSDQVLVESVVVAKQWLEKCESALAPYALLARDINQEMNSLQRQRRNVTALQAELEKELTSRTKDSNQQEDGEE